MAASQGVFSIARPCPECHGSGRIIEEPCETCHGSGIVRRTREFSVKIPPGVKDGARIRLPRRGEPGPPGSAPGDLYVTVHVQPHRVFGRKDSDLTVELPVTYSEATLGAEGWAVDRQLLELPHGLHWTEETDPLVLALVSSCDGAVPLTDQLTILATAHDVEEDALAEVAAPLVAHLVERGFLEIVE